MSDLPERIWIDKTDWYIANFAGDCAGYLRSDLCGAPVVFDDIHAMLTKGRGGV